MLPVVAALLTPLVAASIVGTSAVPPRPAVAVRTAIAETSSTAGAGAAAVAGSGPTDPVADFTIANPGVYRAGSHGPFVVLRPGRGDTSTPRPSRPAPGSGSVRR